MITIVKIAVIGKISIFDRLSTVLGLYFLRSLISSIFVLPIEIRHRRIRYICQSSVPGGHKKMSSNLADQ